jgi:hypothetical protein
MEIQITEIANGTTVMQRVKEFATATNTFTLADVCKAHPGVPKGQLSTALWKARKAGFVTKDDAGVYTVLTDVNKPVEVKATVKPKAKAKAKAKTSKPRPPSAKVTIERLEIRINEAMHEILQWSGKAKDAQDQLDRTQDALLNLRQNHEDALAIIRYLENKLYVALQMVAKHGSNS